MKIPKLSSGIILIILLNPLHSFSQIEVYQDSLKFYYKAKNEVKVLVYLNKILTLSPNSTYYLLIKGAFLHERENYAEAIKSFSKALQINPNLTDAYVRRGITFLQAEKYDSSILDFNQAIGKYKYQDSLIFKYRAEAYLLSNQFELARTDIDSALKYNPHDKELLHNRAIAKIELGDLASARMDLDKVIEEDIPLIAAVRSRAIFNSKVGDFDGALKDFYRYLKHFPEDETSNLMAGAILFDKKEYKNALPYLIKSKANSESKDAYLLSGMCHYFLVHDQQAIDDLTQALKLNPTQPEEAEIYYFIGICKNNLNPKSGCNDIRKAIEKGFADAQKTFKQECE